MEIDKSFSAYFTEDERDTALPLFITSLGIYNDQNRISRIKGFDYFHLFRCVEGQGHVEAGGRAFTLKKDMVMILYPHEPHCYYPDKEPWMLDWLTFRCNNGTEFMRYLGFEHSVAFELPISELLAAELRKMRDMICFQKLYYKTDLSCQLYSVLVDLSKYGPSGGYSTRGISQKKLETVLHFIEMNYSCPFSLGQLSEQVGVSPQHLCLIFKNILHVRPFQYVNSFRINKSKQILLENRKRSVSDIAQDCGFESTCYFNQTFKKITGISPTEFRMLY